MKDFFLIYIDILKINFLNIPLNKNFYGVLLYKTPNKLYTDINFNNAP